MNEELLFQAANARALGRGAPARIWSVSQVNALARQLLEGSIPSLWVAGEVSGFKRLPAGHCFFNLKDERAQISCVMWSEAARALPTEPAEGMAVHVYGRPSVYERQGRFQFVVSELTARGEGLWRLALERIRRQLEAEGLLDPGRKRPLPRYPMCVGVVTSTEGAALRDIVSVIRRRAPWTDIIVYPTRVQGRSAAPAIIAAVRRACKARRAQVLIVGRGGGSVEDLWAFNDERVAREIARSSIPVISAVGHEIDVTLADLVADRRAPTPSAAAEFAVPERDSVLADLERAGDRMTASLRDRMARGLKRLEAMESRLVEALRRGLDRRRLALESASRRLQALGPMAVLRRGYALALDQDDRVLRSARSFAPGMQFTLRMRDGRIRARTQDVAQEK